MTTAHPVLSSAEVPVPAPVKRRASAAPARPTVAARAAAARQQELAGARRGESSLAVRQRELRATWLATVDALRRRRADLVGERAIAEYVALYWLEWSGGALRLTALGDNICQQLRAGME